MMESPHQLSIFSDWRNASCTECFSRLPGLISAPASQSPLSCGGEGFLGEALLGEEAPVYAANDDDAVSGARPPALPRTAAECGLFGRVTGRTSIGERHESVTWPQSWCPFRRGASHLAAWQGLWSPP